MDKNKKKTITEKAENIGNLTQNEAFKQVVDAYQPTYNSLFYLGYNLTERQKKSLKKRLFKMLLKDIKKTKKIAEETKKEDKKQ